MSFVIKAENLKVWYPVRRSLLDVILRKPQLYVHAVDGISLEIKPGETYCLVGESGCGKSTTGRALIRLVENAVVSGRVLFRPSEKTLEEIAKLAPQAIVDKEQGIVDIYKVPDKYMKPLRRELQIVFQDPFGSLNPRMKIGEILEEPLLIHGIGETYEERLEIVMKALEMVKLTPPEDFVNRYPHQLSGGQRQRVSIAKALLLNPRFIVADEPVSMLDVSIRAEVLEILNELRDKHKLAQLFITHDLALARYVCDRIAVMYLGKIVEEAEADELINNPLHPYTKALISAIPEPDPSNRLKTRYLPIKGEVTSAIHLPKGCRFRPRCLAYDENEQVRSLCEKEEPPLVEVKQGHKVACWLYAKK
ncbi:ABC transporter ATP-binding protein [Hyperthermus butylicus]|uniref:Oligopeptide transport ATP-binding protein n=1 Tax=Hyperthermus butylicus (strain DSM 5456 / JCM 9403 / PLM1-5) TaxID=415426 RepID=A2BL14_HYPBU|nr:ABC transporter ATP-binding protein [Hyperthermus butylicus]ABM80675.1 Oligopeptide transport ATP-binding protein [Hyperthermus butylicus DSM 5456]